MKEEEIGRLLVRIVGDTSSVRKEFTGVDNLLKKTGQTARSETKNVEVFGKTIDELGTKMSNFVGQMMAVRAIQSPMESIKESINLAAEAEQMEVNFGTMLKSIDAGKQMTADLQKFAAQTPLSLAGLQASTKILLQFGVAGEDIIPTIKMLGDVALGDEQKLASLSLAFGQMRSTGRLMGQELLQMINAGFNPLQEISRTTGKSMVQLKDDMEKGKITVGMVEAAFKSATSEGGQFKDGMLSASKTLTGLLSTMADDFDAMKREVGKSVIEMFKLKEVVALLSEVAQFLTGAIAEMNPNLKFLLNVVLLAGAAFGVLVIAWKAGAIAIGMVVGVLKDFVITMRWIIPATWEWVKGINASKIALIALKVAAVAAVAWIGFELGYALSGARAAQEQYNKAIEEGIKLTESLVSTTGKRIDKELEAIKAMPAGAAKKAAGDELAGGLERDINHRASAIDRYKKKIEELTDLIRTGNPFSIMERRGERARLQRELDDLIKIQEEYKKKLKDVRDATKDATEDPAINKAVTELNDKLETQIQTWGMTSREVEIYKLKMMGATEAQLANLRHMDSLLTGLEKQKEAEKKAADEAKKRADTVKNLTDRLLEENAALRFSQDEMEIAKMIANGASVAQISLALAVQESTKALKQYERSMEEGMRITEQYKTPQATFNDQVAKLTSLFLMGAIGIDTYTVAMADAKTKLDEAEKGAEKTRREMERLDAVMAGSAEAKARIAAFAERNKAPDLRPIVNRGINATVNAENGPMIKALMMIEENTRIAAAKEPIELEDASIK